MGFDRNATEFTKNDLLTLQAMNDSKLRSGQFSIPPIPETVEDGNRFSNILVMNQEVQIAEFRNRRSPYARTARTGPLNGIASTPFMLRASSTRASSLNSA